MAATTRTERVGRFGRAMRTVLATGGAFALAAFLALLLVPSRFDATVLWTPVHATSEWQAQAIRNPVMPRAPTPWGAIAAWRENVSVRPEQGGAGIVVTASADGEVRARARALSFVRRFMEAIPLPPAAAASNDAVDAEALRAELASLPTEADADLDAIDASFAELETARRSLESERAAAEQAATQASEFDPQGEAPNGWGGDAALDRLSAERRSLRAAIDGWGDTLAESNPRRRIAEQRLAAVEARLSDAAAEWASRADARLAALGARQAVLDEERTALEVRRDAIVQSTARRAELLAALAQAEGQEQAVDVGEELRVLSIEERDPPYGAAVATAGLVGLLAGLLAVCVSWLARRSQRPAAAFEPQQATGLDPVQAGPVSPVVAPPAFSPGPRPVPSVDPLQPVEPVPIGDIVSVLTGAPVSRILTVAAGTRDIVPSSLLLARRLAEAGTLVLLVDLSLGQGASKAAGVPRGLPGLREAAEERLGLASVTWTDEDSGADIVPGGREGGAGVPRQAATVLSFARRAYDHVIVDCGRQPAESVVRLADEDCAVLLAPQGASASEVRARLRELAASGLCGVIVLEDEALPCPASARKSTSTFGKPGA